MEVVEPDTTLIFFAFVFFVCLSKGLFEWEIFTAETQRAQRFNRQQGPVGKDAKVLGNAKNIPFHSSINPA